MNTTLLIPPLDSKALHTPTPSLHLRGDILAAPADIDTGSVLEQFRRRGPFVRFELPGLTGCEDGNEARPVVRFEIGGTVHENEFRGFGSATTGVGSDCRGAGVGGIGFEADGPLEFHEVGFGGHA